MTDEFEIRKYRQGDLEAILGLRELVFDGLDRERERRRWNWEFEANPFCGDSADRSWIIEHESRMVGHYGLIPYEVGLGDRTVSGLCGIDFCIDPELQGRGIGGRLIRRFLEPGLTDFPFLVVPTPVTAHLMVKFGAVLIDGQHESFLFSFPSGSELAAPEPGPDLELEAVTDFDRRFDDFAVLMRRHYPLQIRRSAAFLNWRYRDYPFCACQTTAARGRDGQLRGYVVFQPDRSERRGYVLDLICDPEDQDTVRSLLCRAISQARQRDLPELFLLSRDQRLQRLLPGWGFSVVRPHVISFVCRTPAGAPDPLDWHVSPGDGDLLFSVNA